MFHSLGNLQLHLSFDTDNNISINRFFQLNLEDLKKLKLQINLIFK